MWNRAFLIGFDNGGPGETMAFPDNSHAHFHHPLPLISFSFKCVQLSWIFSNVVQEHDMKYCPELVPPIQILHWKAKERKRERGTPESERNRWKSIKRAERMVPKKKPQAKRKIYIWNQKKKPTKKPNQSQIKSNANQPLATWRIQRPLIRVKWPSISQLAAVSSSNCVIRVAIFGYYWLTLRWMATDGAAESKAAARQAGGSIEDAAAARWHRRGRGDSFPPTPIDRRRRKRTKPKENGAFCIHSNKNRIKW